MTCPIKICGSIFTALSIVSIFFQSFLAYVLQIRVKLDKPCYKILQSLCLADIVFGLTIITYMAIEMTDETPGEIPPLFINASGTISTMTSALLSLDRFTTIKFGLYYPRLAESKLTSVSLIAVWLTSFTAFGLAQIEDPSSNQTEGPIRSSTDILMCLTTYISAMTTSAVNIYLYQQSRTQFTKILQQVNTFKDTPAAKNEIRFCKQRQKKSKEIMWISSSVIIVPFLIAMALTKRLLAPSATDASLIVALTSCATLQRIANPFIYAFLMSEVRAEIRKICSWRQHQVDVASSPNTDSPVTDRSHMEQVTDKLSAAHDIKGQLWEMKGQWLPINPNQPGQRNEKRETLQL